MRRKIVPIVRMVCRCVPNLWGSNSWEYLTLVLKTWTRWWFQGLVLITSNIARQSSVFPVRSGALMATPALLIHTSTPPNSSLIFVNIAKIWSSLDTSHRIDKNDPFSFCREFSISYRKRRHCDFMWMWFHVEFTYLIIYRKSSS